MTEVTYPPGWTAAHGLDCDYQRAVYFFYGDDGILLQGVFGYTGNDPARFSELLAEKDAKLRAEGIMPLNDEQITQAFEQLRENPEP